MGSWFSSASESTPSRPETGEETVEQNTALCNKERAIKYLQFALNKWYGDLEHEELENINWTPGQIEIIKQLFIKYEALKKTIPNNLTCRSSSFSSDIDGVELANPMDLLPLFKSYPGELPPRGFLRGGNRRATRRVRRRRSKTRRHR